ncbi:MAG: zinc ribbon domain-containing protein [Fimbriimonadales bacterium]
MPIYEYRCDSCRKRFSLLVGMTAERHEEKCPHCGSETITKLVSRFHRYRSEDDRIDELADTLESMGEPDDPKEMRRLVREMGKAMDEDMSGEMEELFEEDMAGEGENGEKSDED